MFSGGSGAMKDNTSSSSSYSSSSSSSTRQTTPLALLSSPAPTSPETHSASSPSTASSLPANFTPCFTTLKTSKHKPFKPPRFVSPAAKGVKKPKSNFLVPAQKTCQKRKTKSPNVKPPEKATSKILPPAKKPRFQAAIVDRDERMDISKDEENEPVDENLSERESGTVHEDKDKGCLFVKCGKTMIGGLEITSDMTIGEICKMVGCDTKDVDTLVCFKK